MTHHRFSLSDFVRESNHIEGIHRAPSAAEIHATERFLALPQVTISSLIDLVAVYAPNARPRFVEGLNVRVGAHVPPPGGPMVQRRLVSMLENEDHPRDAYEMHVEYETVHPFTDGNGRSGRALWLWYMGGIEKAPLGFLHHFYYQTLQRAR
jgi:hypothetical protein